ncbi:MAG: AAA family ATPase [Gammaproteobacteria bacterium]|nr:AAA family ATPase [Gammaproteobacteria bacterium]
MARKSLRDSRHPSIRLALYNHKGGVGKTTLTVNIASALADIGKRVLLVDADPQCNLTSYLVEPGVVDDWLDNSDSETGVTIWSSIKPIAESTGEVREVKPPERLKNIFLIPGDIRLSEFEQDLQLIWTECLQRKMRGFRGASAISEVVNIVATQIKADFVFYDVGPNIGALNRVVLLDCDYFIVPAACDLFSTRALSTLGHSLSSWIKDWQVISQLAPDGMMLLPGRPKFMGYILQKFRMYGGAISGSFAPYVAKLEKTANSEIATVLRRIDKDLASASFSQNKLGQVKDFGGLATLAQEQGQPFALVNGGTQAQKTEAKAEFERIAKHIIQRTEIIPTDS